MESDKYNSNGIEGLMEQYISKILSLAGKYAKTLEHPYIIQQQYNLQMHLKFFSNLQA